MSSRPIYKRKDDTAFNSLFYQEEYKIKSLEINSISLTILCQILEKMNSLSPSPESRISKIYRSIFVCWEKSTDHNSAKQVCKCSIWVINLGTIHEEVLPNFNCFLPGQTIKVDEAFFQVWFAFNSKKHNTKHMQGHDKTNQKASWGLFQLKRLKSEIKHKFEQKVKNVSINRKHFIDNYIDLVSIETFKI